MYFIHKWFQHQWPPGTTESKTDCFNVITNAVIFLIALFVLERTLYPQQFVMPN